MLKDTFVISIKTLSYLLINVN